MFGSSGPQSLFVITAFLFQIILIVHFALRTGDCDAALKRAQAAGATVTVAPKDAKIPSRTGAVSVRIAFIRAPGGEVIEFFQDMRG